MNHRLTKEEVYKNSFIKYELVKAMKNREVILLGQETDFVCIRPILILNVRYLEILFNLNKTYTNTNNVYVSLAKYIWIPPMKIDTNRKEVKELWNETGYKYMCEYDLLLDFDSNTKKEYSELRKEVLNISTLLLKNEVMFMLYPSSKNGFHILIPSEIMNREKKFYHIEEQRGFNFYIKDLATRFKEVFNLKYMDLKGIGTWNKIRKCEFSYTKYAICKPILNLEKISKNDISDIYEPSKVLSEFTANYHPQKYFNEGQPLHILQNNFDNFLKKYNLEVWTNDK